MASKQEQTFPLTLWLDTEKYRVVVAEASGDFIDTLFSFLVLPLGTIIRLVSNEQQHDQPIEIGCINNLYHSVENSSADQFFWKPQCKQMLLRPRNPYEAHCQKLKRNVDDTEPTKYFTCRSKCGNPYRLLSTFAGTSCRSCEKLMDKEMKLEEESSEKTHTDGVFAKREAKYLIFDDLKLFQDSPCNFKEELVRQGFKNMNELTKMPRDVGLNEILGLLKQALTTNSPLSNVFLPNRASRPRTCTFSPEIVGNIGIYMDLKVIERKSDKKIMYAVAGEDFVDFLFSFLTAPLGSILKLLDGDSSLGCIDNLYKSVNDLNSSWFISQTPLQDPKVAPQFGFRMKPLKLSEQETPIYWHGTDPKRSKTYCFDGNGVISKSSSLVKNPKRMELVDPRFPADGKKGVGYVRRPSLFVVWDDLRVTPLANTSSISFMQKLNVPLDDLEEYTVNIGEEEARNLLRASLTSKAALTDALCYSLKMVKLALYAVRLQRADF